MDSRILEIVFYLMDQAQDSDEQLAGISEFSTDLESLGYTEEEISTAYNWILDHLTSPGESLFSSFPDRLGTGRILTNQERARLSHEAYGFLVKLANLGAINDYQFEKILDRLNLLGPRLITVDQVKLVASAVIFSDRSEMDHPWLSDPEADHSTMIN